MRGVSDPPPFKRLKKHSFSIKPHYLSPDIVFAILAMLPVKTLLKFCSVCKSWNSLIRRDGYFADQHFILNKSSGSGLISLSTPQQLFTNFKLDYKHGSYKVDFTCLGQKVRMTNSCNGLVGVYGRNWFCLSNPSIRKLEILPKGSLQIDSSLPVAAIGFEASARVFKVVRLFTRELKNYTPVKIGCEVLCLSGRSKNTRWKSVKDPPYFEFYGDVLPVSCNGALHWTVVPPVFRESKTRGPEVGLSFDIKEEKFSLLRHPEGARAIGGVVVKSQVVVLGGCLCVHDTLHSQRLVIWILEDHKTSKWAKHYEIDIAMVHKFRFKQRPLTPLKIVDGGIVFYYGVLGQGRREFYDLLARKFVEHETFNKDKQQVVAVGAEYVCPYTESIIWPFLALERSLSVGKLLL